MPEKRQATFVCIVLALAVLAVFGQTAGFRFVNYDDPGYVYDNPVVQKGLSVQNVRWAFTHPQVANWIPLTTLSHMLDCNLFGLRTGGHHFVNVLLHAANAVLLFLVLRQMTRRLWRSAFAAAIFAIHPLRAESVAWVSERKDVLCAFFFLLTIWAYMRDVRQPSSSKYALIMVFFALGLLAKSMVATLPCVLLILDYWPLDRWRNRHDVLRLVGEKIPLFILSVLACWVAAMMPGLVVNQAQRLPLWERIGNALVSYGEYIRQMILPMGLATAYPNPPNGPPKWETGVAIMVLVGVSIWVAKARKQNPFLLAGWLWYLVMLLPVIGIIQISPYASHADRYTYLPGIGLAIAGTWAVGEWSIEWKHRAIILKTLGMAVFLVFAVLGYRQTSFWRDDHSLWTRALAFTSRNSLAHCNLGVSYFDHGEKEKAIAEYREALKIHPDYTEALANLGTALFETGQKKEAIVQFRRALETNPNFAVARGSLGVALFANGDKEEAIAQYRQALAAKPDFAEARSNLGIALFDRGEKQEAIVQYRQALEIDPHYVKAEYNLGNALATEGHFDEAIEHYRKAVETKPEYAFAYYGLATALASKAQWGDAIAQYRQALAVKTNFVEARRGLGKALIRNNALDEAMTCFPQPSDNKLDPGTMLLNVGGDLIQTGDLEEAILCCKRALEMNPGSAEACSDLGLAFFEEGKIKDAIAFWQQALKIKPDQPFVQNNLAWVLATTPDPSLRNGPAAVALAEQADRSNKSANPFVLHTLAAAYAETGRYEVACSTARHALELAIAQKIDDLAGKLPREIKLYESGQPLRDMPQ